RMGGSRSLAIPPQPVDDCFRRIPSVSATLLPERFDRRHKALEVVIHSGHDDEVDEGGHMRVDDLDDPLLVRAPHDPVVLAPDDKCWHAHAVPGRLDVFGLDFLDITRMTAELVVVCVLPVLLYMGVSDLHLKCSSDRQLVEY